MGEDWSPEVKPNMFNWLSLGLIDSHGKCKANRELATPEFDGQLLIWGFQDDPWNEGGLTCMAPSQYATLQDTLTHPYQNKMGAIAKTICSVQIA